MPRKELHKRIEEITLPLEELGLYGLVERLTELEERLLEFGLDLEWDL